MDIVDDFLTRLAQHAPELQAAVPLQLERELRGAWGGSKPYVGQRISRETRLAIIGQGLRAQKSLRTIFAEAGVSRATGSRLLSQKPVLPSRPRATVSNWG